MTEAMKKSNRPVSKKEDLHFKTAAVKLELVSEKKQKMGTYQEERKSK